MSGGLAAGYDSHSAMFTLLCLLTRGGCNLYLQKRLAEMEKWSEVILAVKIIQGMDPKQRLVEEWEKPDTRILTIC